MYGMYVTQTSEHSSHLLNQASLVPELAEFGAALLYDQDTWIAPVRPQALLGEPGSTSPAGFLRGQIQTTHARGFDSQTVII